MEFIDYSHSSLSLLPPLVALGLAILTRRVLVSLGVGILLGALLLHGFSLSGTGAYVFTTFSSVVFDSGNLQIVAFLVLLGMATALLTLSGGTAAFALWAQKRIRTKRDAKLLTASLGVLIFIDDYFNSLAVGSIARPVTDRYYVSRAKLAYLLDSTAAPMCVLMPASSWGAYIITVIGGILVSHGITEYSAMKAFMTLIPMNFYAVFALLLVFVVAWFQVDIGPMRRHEQEAVRGKGFKENDAASSDLNEDLGISESKGGRVSDLLLPILTLIGATIFFFLYTGAQALAADGLSFSLLGALEETDVNISLFYGGLVGLFAALYPVVRQKLPVADIGRTLWVGAKSMFGAILILFFAWSIGGVIGDMATGQYLSTMVEGNISPSLLPVILFLLAGVMAFSTGTSWGTFGIMLPIAGDMAAATEISLMLPMLSAVLAGAVFGDHCSPISDTTILSSTGARCNHIDHVQTQLPYALAAALIASVGFLILGITSSLLTAFIVAFMMFIIVSAGLIWLSRKPTTKPQQV
ncbi:Na+/H+ antiporter NhaC family protein [Thaumasiovibrio sp. DFM-14]|uniref:Na+/H+ antiporter NhaC family protein n=1 Tax=Thaumasiovibrio sp. DFM-14 TaxID=3384792 RepID=UPI0039A33BEA